MVSITHSSEAGAGNASGFAGAVGDIDAAVERAAGALTFVADPAVMADVVADLVQVRNKVDGLVTQFIGQAVTNGSARLVGLRTVGQFVAAYTNADPAPYRAADHRARWLKDFPVFEQAFADGVMSTEHLGLIRRLVDGCGTHFELRGDQQFFVDAARDCSFADFKTVAQTWVATVDPDGKEPIDQQKSTNLSMRVGRGGRVRIIGDFDALDGQAIRTAVDQVAQRMAITDKENGVMRSEGARRAAALVELIAKGAARKDGTYAAPLINIVMSQTFAEWALDQLSNGPTGEAPPVDWRSVDGRCELIDGTPIHPLTAARLFGVAVFRRTILCAEGRLLDVSVNARSFPEWMRTALHLQARGRCDNFACDAPHHWLQIDHIHPVSAGGETRLDNGQPLCGPDNRAKTNQTGHQPWRSKTPPKRKPPRRSQPRRSQPQRRSSQASQSSGRADDDPDEPQAAA